MARNLFVLSLLSFTVVGCVGPKKGPSPVTDGEIVAAPAALTPVSVAPAPVPESVPAKPVTPAKSKGRLPIKNAGNK